MHAGLEQYFHQHGHGVRHVLGRLEHHRVTAQQRRKAFPGGDREREVERCHQAADTDGTPEAHCPFVAQLTGHSVSEELTAHGAGVVCGVDALLHVATGLGERLAHLARHDVGQLFLAGGEQVTDATQDVTARGGGQQLPRTESPYGTGDRTIDVRGGRARKAAHEIRRVGRIAVLEPGAGGCGHPLASDVIQEVSHGAVRRGTRRRLRGRRGSWKLALRQRLHDAQYLASVSPSWPPTT